MRIIRPMVIVEDDLSMEMPNGTRLNEHMLKKTEMFTRKCYKSEGRITEDSCHKFLPAVFGTRRHTGIAEHRVISVTFITDRGVSHEGVRHRMAAYLQESTRYCDYTDEGKAPQGVTYILPPWVQPSDKFSPQARDMQEAKSIMDWREFLIELEADDQRYARWRSRGWAPEQARYWLPQGVKTEYVASLNLGSWHNFVVKRVDPAAHPQMRQLAIPLLRYFQMYLPEFFDDVTLPFAEDGRFNHKNIWYDEAKLVVNPYYDQVPFDVVYEGEAVHA